MIAIECLTDCEGADKFGTCASCSKDSSEDKKMVRIRIGSVVTGYYRGTSLCLCDECKRTMCKMFKVT